MESQGCKKGSPVIIRRPLILSSSRWNSIRSHLTKGTESLQQAEQERKFKEYLKEGSLELTKKWPDIIHKDELPEEKKDTKPAGVDWELEKQKLKNEDDRLRREQINKAQQLIQRAKPGPRELDSAYMICEVQKGRDIQRKINAEFNKSIQDQRLKDEMKEITKVDAFAEEERKRIIENRKRNEEYKNELIKAIKEEEKNKAENNKRQREFEKKLREQADKDLQAQIERERAILQRKKETMRKNALEAMKMVEQRRLRDEYENEIDNHIIALFAKGKEQIKHMKEDKEKQLRKDRIEFIEANAKKVFAKFVDDTAREEQKLQQHIDEMNAKYEQQERQKIQKEKALKAARIRSHIEEIERQKLMKAQKLENMRWDMANRLKNEEVTEEFERQRQQDKLKKAREIRAVLLEQAKEKKLQEDMEKKIDQYISNIPDDENKFFMQYADKLIEDTKNKSRPILPLLRAVEKYKKENALDIIRTEPKHLRSNIPINEGSCSPRSSGQPVIKYDLNELKQMNPRSAQGAPLWA